MAFWLCSVQRLVRILYIFLDNHDCGLRSDVMGNENCRVKYGYFVCVFTRYHWYLSVRTVDWHDGEEYIVWYSMIYK